MSSGNLRTENDIRLRGAAQWIYKERWKELFSGELMRGRMLYLADRTGNPWSSEIDEPFLKRVRLKFRKERKKPATINRYFAHVKTILNTAILEWKIDARLPRFRLEKEPPGRIRVITDGGEAIILKTLRQAEGQRRKNFPQVADLVVVLVDTGCGWVKLSE